MTAIDAEKTASSPGPTDSDSTIIAQNESPVQDQEPQEHHHDLTQELSRASSIWVTDTMSLPREALFVFIVCMAQFTTQSAYLGTLVLLETIGSSFGVTSPPRLAWLVGGFSLTVGTFIMVSGRLGDLFGYKKMLIIGFSWFSIWSMVSGLSVYDNYTLAVFSRVLQGIGPAICLPNGLAIFGAAYPPGHRKAMVFAFFGAVAPIGAVIGAAFASVIALAWWPWAQWALAIWTAFLAVAASFIIPSMPQKVHFPKGWKERAEALDLLGAVVGIVALVLFNFAWTQAPISGWNTATCIVPLVLGLALFGAFVYIEFKVSPNPLLPYAAVNADVAFVLAAVVCGWATFGVWTLYITQILQHIRHLTPLNTVAWFVPVTISGGCAAVVTGKLLGPWQVRPPVVMSMALLAFTVGVTLTAFTPINQTYWGQTFVSMIVMPFGMDMSFPAATLILSNAVSKKHQGIGASLVNTVVNYGIAMGVGFAGTVDVHVSNGGMTEADQLKGYRGGLYMGIGLAGLGLGVCLMFLLREHFWKKN